MSRPTKIEQKIKAIVEKEVDRLHRKAECEIDPNAPRTKNNHCDACGQSLEEGITVDDARMLEVLLKVEKSIRGDKEPEKPGEGMSDDEVKEQLFPKRGPKGPREEA